MRQVDVQCFWLSEASYLLPFSAQRLSYLLTVQVNLSESLQPFDLVAARLIKN
jgi:hypothetical protein